VCGFRDRRDTALQQNFTVALARLRPAVAVRDEQLRPVHAYRTRRSRHSSSSSNAVLH